MKLSDLKTRIKIQVPNFNDLSLSDTSLASLINEACDQINLLCKVYKGYTDFDLEAEKRVYNLSVVCPNYLGADKRGLFIQDTSDDWQYVIPKTEAWISERIPDYLNASSIALPTYYYIDVDELGFHPKPSTATECRLYHLKKATVMSSDDHYPWTGTTVEIPMLKALDDAIVAFVRWKLSPSFGQVSDVDLRYREFISECSKGAKQIKRRPDLTNDSSYCMELSV